MKSAVTHIQILMYYSTFVQMNVSQLQSFRDQITWVRKFYNYRASAIKLPWSQFEILSTWVSVKLIWKEIKKTTCLKGLAGNCQGIVVFVSKLHVYSSDDLII